MIAERYRVPTIAIMIFLFHVIGITSMNAQQKSTRQSSIEAFSKGEFELAYNGFNELLIVYPKDPLYRYYSGVCLIKLNREPEKALILLQQAQQGSAVVRTIPSDALFWLGRARQMTGRFTEAISSYNEFTVQYGKKAARELDIPGYLQQCQDRKGQVTETASKSVAEEKRPVKTDYPVAEAQEQKTTDVPVSDGIQDPIPVNFDLILSEALEYQFKADSLTKLAEEWTNDPDKLEYKSKTELRVKIAETEKLASSYQKKADLKYNEAQVSMNSAPFSQVRIVEKDTVIKADLSETKRPLTEPSVSKTATAVKKDSVIVKSSDVYSVFAFKSPGSFSGNKIPVNAAIPPGLIYRVQVAVFKNPVALSYFKGLTPIYGFRATGAGSTAYYAGLFRRIQDARKALVTVRQKGFRDAFIVAFSGGKQVSIERAAVLEKEWGNKPLFAAQPAKQASADTIPPELCFRVEVMRSVKPVKPELLEEMKKIAGTRGLDTESNPKGPTVYLIGKFITYESASNYADLLVRNGYRDAKVVARLGIKEMPVETARKLFEKLE
jgi:hypothetical protein